MEIRNLDEYKTKSNNVYINDLMDEILVIQKMVIDGTERTKKSMDDMSKTVEEINEQLNEISMKLSKKNIIARLISKLNEGIND